MSMVNDQMKWSIKYRAISSKNPKPFQNKNKNDNSRYDLNFSVKMKFYYLFTLSASIKTFQGEMCYEVVSNS